MTTPRTTVRPLLAVVVAVALAACTAQPTEVKVPDGVDVVAVADAQGRPLLGLDRGGSPALWLDGSEVPLTPATADGYPAGAGILGLAADGEQVTAYGLVLVSDGQPRYTVWSGTTAGVTEHPTEALGGGSGRIVGAAYADGQAAIVGSRQSATSSSFDIAVWQQAAPGVWEVQPAAAELVSTAAAQVQPNAAAGAGSRLVVVGQTNDLAAGIVRASAWVREGTSWTKVNLPADASESSADAVSCDADGCLVAGTADGRLAAWTLGWDGVPVQQLLPATTPDADTVVHASRVPGASRILVTVGGRGVLLTEGSAVWTSADAPAGVPVEAVTVGGRTVVVSEADGRPRVWTIPGR